MVNNRTSPSQPGGPGSCAAATTGRNPPARGHPFLSGVASDLAHFSPRRTWAMARLMVREAIRLRVLGVLVVGLLAIIVADLTSRYFDPVFQATGGLIAVAEVTITLVGMALALFLATYSVPHELTTRTVYSLVTKPVSRLEIIAGKMLGLMVVLAMVTFGLGLLSYGYILHRAQKVKAMAAARLQERPADDQPLALRTIAERGPLGAVVYQKPSQSLRIVYREGRRDVEWLSGYVTHRAHWGFSGLPLEATNSGRTRVLIDVQLPPPATGRPWSDQQRKVRVRLHDGSPRSQQSLARVYQLDKDGHLEITIPGTRPDGKSFYTGGQLWVSLCGAGTRLTGADEPAIPIAVKDSSCKILLPEGRSIVSGSGLMLSTSFSSNKSWIGGGGSTGLLMGRVRFDDLPSGVVGAGQATLQIDVAVPTASNVAPDARAQVTIVNDTTGDRHRATFRPEKGTTALVDVPAKLLKGDRLSVYLRSLDERVEMGINDQSIHLRIADRPFIFNWAKVLVMMWLSFCVVAAIGLCISTFVGWYVAVLFTAIAMVVANVWSSVVTAAMRGRIAVLGSAKGGGSPVASQIYAAVFRFFGRLLPDFDKMDYGDVASRGVDAPLSALVGIPEGALWHALLYTLAMVALGYVIFRLREVAR